ncbi:hypothetical protein TH25_24385 [Thalassospira profundimaris]|uniref:Adenylyl/Guanylyl and SMODS C-terminal sensor domain-containing protein n=1 Tax=Thalassospira profundimaris TaxID=502049 RepID=A0A367WGQ4_9PROT|nr:nucleotidyltransferase [Thalassospira profundimaris]MBR9780957.1 nucleotidyltransferase [Rhodospirillales bacterium]MBR9815510.1 nucleotidyltransferase [Rhodospirillales bacterium]RCK40577.1 hypothetical protein TH25_24385 [Thalassospira profundimaris]
MKLTARFDDFLRDTVNLNQARIDLLSQRVDTIKRFLRDSDYEPKIIRFAAQGSWAHKTIIKPPTGNKEFDADLVVYLEPVDDWDAAKYVNELRRVFRASATYKDKTSRKSRCVTVDYAGDFHLDVVPIVVREHWLGSDTYEVCNRAENCFEASDGDGFKEWWSEQNKAVGGNYLIKTARLLKYLRDTKSTFSAKSVLLTTLIGERVGVFDGVIFDTYPDLPTTLKVIVGRLDDWLQENPDLPAVENPALPGESFTRKWTQEQYDNFRNKISQYREWVDDAYGEEDRDESIKKWRRLFGESFAKGEVKEAASRRLRVFADAIQQGKDLVSLVEARGRQILTQMPANLPQVVSVPYRNAANQVPVRIVAYERAEEDGADLRPLTSGDMIHPNSGIYFRAVQQASGLPFSKDFKVEWQVVNTDEEAANSDCLRGGFYPSKDMNSRYEPTKFRGVHWVQAFLINKRTRLVCGVSDRFFVVIA